MATVLQAINTALKPILETLGLHSNRLRDGEAHDRAQDAILRGMSRRIELGEVGGPMGPTGPTGAGTPGVTGPTGPTGSGGSSTKLLWEDDFDYTNTVFNSVNTVPLAGVNIPTGRGNWAALAITGTGSYDLIAGEANHPGILRLTSNAANAWIILQRGGLAAYTSPANPYLINQLLRAEVCFRVSGISGSQVFWGLRDLNGFGVFFHLNGAQLNAVCATSGGAGTTTVLTAGVGDSNFHSYRIEQITLGTATFYYDNVLVATISTNVPLSLPSNWIMWCIRSSAAIIVHVDYAAFESQRLVR